MGNCFIDAPQFTENCFRVGFIRLKFLLKGRGVKKPFFSGFLAKLAGLGEHLPELKTVLPNACLRRVFGRPADFVIEGQVDPREPVRNEAPFSARTGFHGQSWVE